MSLFALSAKLRDEGMVLCDEAADAIDEFEHQLTKRDEEIEVLEDEANALRRRVADLEEARLCRRCAFGTTEHESVFCAACGARR